MAVHIELTARLPASADEVWSAVLTPRLLAYIAKGRLTFSPINPPAFPQRWEARDYVVGLRWRGVLPLGRHILSVSFPPPDGATRYVRDNGSSALVRRWDHLISISPRDDGATDYVDSIDLDAGLLTPALTQFARSFYTHRQCRLLQLCRNGFDYAG